MANLKMGRNVELALDAKATLGEGPMWHARRKKLYWVDILEKKLHEFDPPTGCDRAFNAGQFVGCVAARKKGGLVLGLQHGFAYFNFRTKKICQLIETGFVRSGNRINDGKCDPAGRFWAGTMNLNARANHGSLLYLDTDLHVRQVLHNLTIPNGIIWSLDMRTMFFIDSGRQIVWAFDYDGAAGQILNRRAVIRIAKRDGVPDGMTIDAEGMLWVALWGGGRVTRWNPQSGKLLQTVPLPVSLVTSCAFGGAKLDVLFITSARTSLGKDALSKEPLAGGIFRVPTDVCGIPSHPFRG
jgi:sugar lactone lactonase YvrE